MKPRLTHLQNLALSAMFLAVGLVLPFLTGQIREIGSMLLPMHLPVMLCGLICGWQYGAAIGFVMPLLRHALFSMPPMPGAVSMALELCTYGFVIGLLYGKSRWKCTLALYRSLLSAMICGRIVWGVSQFIILGVRGSGFTFKMFLAGALLQAFPGIVLQLILIPGIMLALGKTGLVPFDSRKKENA